MFPYFATASVAVTLALFVMFVRCTEISAAAVIASFGGGAAAVFFWGVHLLRVRRNLSHGYWFDPDRPTRGLILLTWSAAATLALACIYLSWIATRLGCFS